MVASGRGGVVGGWGWDLRGQGQSTGEDESQMEERMGFHVMRAVFRDQAGFATQKSAGKDEGRISETPVSLSSVASNVRWVGPTDSQSAARPESCPTHSFCATPFKICRFSWQKAEWADRTVLPAGRVSCRPGRLTQVKAGSCRRFMKVSKASVALRKDSGMTRRQDAGGIRSMGTHFKPFAHSRQQISRSAPLKTRQA